MHELCSTQPEILQEIKVSCITLNSWYSVTVAESLPVVASASVYNEVDCDSIEYFQDCDLIAKILGNLPLALGQAASYIAATKTLPRTYLKLYHEKKEEILQQKPPKSIWQYEETVFTTWEISFASISQDFPEAASLLVMGSFFEPSDVPFVIFKGSQKRNSERARTWATLGPGKSFRLRKAVQKIVQSGREDIWPIRPIHWLETLLHNDTTFRKAVNILLDYSMIVENKVQSGFSMHAMVQAWCQTRNDLHTRQRGFDAVLSLGRCIDIDLGEPESWPLLRLTYPHVCNIARICIAQDLGTLWTNSSDFSFPHALEQIGESLAYMYRNKEATELHLYNYNCIYSKLQSSNAMVINMLCKAATTMESDGMKAKAELLWNRVVSDSKKYLGPNHWDTLLYMGNLGANLISQDKIREANELLKGVAWRRHEKFGLEAASPNFINLGVTFLELGKLDEAWSVLKLARDGEEKSNSTDLTNLFHTMDWMSLVLSKEDRRKEAEKILVSTAELAESKYGFEHPLTFQRYKNWLKFLTEDPKTLEDSDITCFLETVARVTKAWMHSQEPFRSRLAELQESVANFLYGLGDRCQARVMIKEALAVFEKQRGDDLGFRDERILADILATYGLISWDEGRVDDAIDLLQRSLITFERLSSSQSFEADILNIKNNIAVAYRDSGRLSEAETLLKETGDDRRSDNADDFLDQNNLASVYVLQNRLTEAMALFTNVIDNMAKALGGTHPYTLLTKHNLACLLEQLDRRKDAIVLLEEVFEGKLSALALRSPATLKTALTLGRMYRANGRYEDARNLADKIRAYLEYA